MIDNNNTRDFRLSLSCVYIIFKPTNRHFNDSNKHLLKFVTSDYKLTLSLYNQTNYYSAYICKPPNPIYHTL